MAFTTLRTIKMKRAQPRKSRRSRGDLPVKRRVKSDFSISRENIQVKLKLTLDLDPNDIIKILIQESPKLLVDLISQQKDTFQTNTTQDQKSDIISDERKQYMIKNPIGFLERELIEDFHSIIKNYGLMDTISLEDLTAQLYGGPCSVEKLNWRKKKNMLAHLFRYLKDKLFPDREDVYEMISERFRIKGKDVTSANLEKNYKKGISNKNKEIIEKCFFKLLKKWEHSAK